MIYCGQELGELGMDCEGFSGVDGRTTIFDYWGVKSIQAWNNDGKFDGKQLTDEQRNLRLFYQKLLNISITEKAITDGLMFDLEYANLNNPRFNPHEQYAYFRKYEDELIFVILNFDDKQLDTDVCFPAEAFQYLQLTDGEHYEMVNLLDETEKFLPVSFSSKEPFSILMPPWTGKILKLNKQI
jgi:hypothetical protein